MNMNKFNLFTLDDSLTWDKSRPPGVYVNGFVLIGGPFIALSNASGICEPALLLLVVSFFFVENNQKILI